VRHRKTAHRPVLDEVDRTPVSEGLDGQVGNLRERVRGIERRREGAARLDEELEASLGPA